jgi:polyphosphate kinase 2 (PPK2 family)
MRQDRHFQPVLLRRGIDRPSSPGNIASRSGVGRRAENHEVWQERYRSIVNLEHHLHCDGTRIVKIFLHLSKGERRRRLLERIDTQHKNWKMQPSDIEERKYWKEYRKAYEDCLDRSRP